MALLLVLGVGGASAARADDALDRLNRAFASIPADRRSDTITLPVWAKTAEPPEVLTDARTAALLPASSSLFGPVGEWAKAQPQQDALEALKKAVAEEDWKKAFVFAQPYGIDAVDPDLVIANLYTDLGDPPTLAGADHRYLPLLRRIEILAHVEATRLLAEGRSGDAQDVILAWAFFARQIADRPFLTEQVFAYEAMLLAVERLRDLAWVDFRGGSAKLLPDHQKELIRKLRPRTGLLGLERLRLPEGDPIGADQLMDRIFIRRGGPDPVTFAPVLAQISARNRPLRRLGELARWEVLARQHAGEFDTREKIKLVYNDWLRRWELGPFDPVQRLETDYAKMDRVKFAAVYVLVQDQGVLFAMRDRLRVELAGTRMALALNGAVLLNRALPPDLSAARPAFVQAVEIDPLSREGRHFEFFVPIRDNVRARREDPQPHQITVVPGGGAPNLSIRLRDDVFVLYSVGPDGAANGCVKATQLIDDPAGDFLIWPPVMSLVRQNLEETGKFR